MPVMAVQLEQLPGKVVHQLSVILQHSHAQQATIKTVTLFFTPRGDNPHTYRTTCRPWTPVGKCERMEIVAEQITTSSWPSRTHLYWMFENFTDMARHAARNITNYSHVSTIRRRNQITTQPNLPLKTRQKWDIHHNDHRLRHTYHVHYDPVSNRPRRVTASETPT